MKSYPAKQPGFYWNWLIISLIIISACSHQRSAEKRISFPLESWPRFTILKYEFPITETERSYDILFELRSSKSFASDDLSLNMVLYTPSGEERIKEYKMPIKDKTGSFVGTFNEDTCITKLVLKRDLFCSVKGTMKLEIENINPKMETEGVYSASLILVQR